MDKVMEFLREKDLATWLRKSRKNCRSCIVMLKVSDDSKESSCCSGQMQRQTPAAKNEKSYIIRTQVAEQAMDTTAADKSKHSLAESHWKSETSQTGFSRLSGTSGSQKTIGENMNIRRFATGYRGKTVWFPPNTYGRKKSVFR